MEPGEALGTAAQIAVALAGFAGVVVVFRRESIHEWSPIDKLRLRRLLTNSILPLGPCMIGLLLLTIKPIPLGIWRWCSGFAFVAGFPLRHYDDEDLSSFGSATDTAWPGQPDHFLSLRNLRDSSKSSAIVTTLPCSAHSCHSSPGLSSKLSPPCSSLRG
jgi:hypothetical protein